jgi:hypothetical protein
VNPLADMMAPIQLIKRRQPPMCLVSTQLLPQAYAFHQEMPKLTIQMTTSQSTGIVFIITLLPLQIESPAAEWQLHSCAPGIQGVETKPLMKLHKTEWSPMRALCQQIHVFTHAALQCRRTLHSWQNFFTTKSTKDTKS